MGNVQIRLGNIFDNASDLVLIPCSAKGTFTKFAQQHQIRFNLPPPREMRLGDIQFHPFPGSGTITHFFAWCASVKDDFTSPADIERIAFRAGEITRENGAVRLVETPLLGTGHGRLTPEDSVVALARGFRASSHLDVTIVIYAVPNDVVDKVRKALDSADTGSLSQPSGQRPNASSEGSPSPLKAESRAAARESGHQQTDSANIGSSTASAGQGQPSDSSKSSPSTFKAELQAGASGLTQQQTDSKAKRHSKRKRTVRSGRLVEWLIRFKEVREDNTESHTQITRSTQRRWRIAAGATLVVIISAVALNWPKPVTMQVQCTGTVLEEVTGSPVPDVKVTLVGAPGVTTDATGNFVITVPRTRIGNTYQLLISHKGYETSTTNVTGPQPLPIVVNLKKKNVEPQYDRAAFEKAKQAREEILKVIQQHYVLIDVGLPSRKTIKGAYRLTDVDPLRRFHKESHFMGFVKGYGGDKARVHSIAPIVHRSDGTIETLAPISDKWQDEKTPETLASLEYVINGLDCDGGPGKGPYCSGDRFDGWV